MVFSNLRLHILNEASDPCSQRIVIQKLLDSINDRFDQILVLNPLLQPVLDMAEIWFAQFYPSITFHDPLAAATIFEPDLCSYQQGMVSIDSAEEQARTIWQPGGPDAPHQVAMTVDMDRYFQHFFSVVA